MGPSFEEYRPLPPERRRFVPEVRRAIQLRSRLPPKPLFRVPDAAGSAPPFHSLEECEGAGLPSNLTRFEQAKPLKLVGHCENGLIVGGSGKSHLAPELPYRALQHRSLSPRLQVREPR